STGLERRHILVLVQLAGKLVGTEIEMVVYDDSELHTAMVNTVTVKNPAKGYRNNLRESLNSVGQIVLADSHNELSAGLMVICTPKVGKTLKRRTGKSNRLLRSFCYSNEHNLLLLHKYDSPCGM